MRLSLCEWSATSDEFDRRATGGCPADSSPPMTVDVNTCIPINECRDMLVKIEHKKDEVRLVDEFELK